MSRVFAVVRTIACASESLTASELGRVIGAPLSSTHDLLRTLVELDLIVCEEGRYAIGPAAIMLSAQVLDGVTVRTHARPHLVELAERTGEAVYLAVPSGGRLIYVDRFLGASRISIHIRLGEPLYLHATAVGKLFAALDPRYRQRLFESRRPALTPRTITEVEPLTAELEKIVSCRMSVTRSESYPGILGIAVPIWSTDGGLVAAIHVSSAEAAMDDERLGLVVEEMRRTAALVMTSMGSRSQVRDEPWPEPVR